MARRPTPCGQRIQPLFARSENVEKKTVKMIFDLFGLGLGKPGVPRGNTCNARPQACDSGSCETHSPPAGARPAGALSCND